jgi:hypothetical protein
MNKIETQTAMRSEATMNHTTPGGRRARRLVLTLVASIVVLASIAAAPALADFGIQPGSFTSVNTNQDGTVDTQAGSHPYQSVTSFHFTTTDTGQPNGNVKDVIVDLPPGVVGDPNATPHCTVTQLDNNNCSGDSQVGTLGLTVNIGGGDQSLVTPLYNMTPPAGNAAEFAANVLVVNSPVDVTVRTGGDYGLRTTVANISANLPLTGTTLTLWGVPADPSHDAARQCPGFVTPCSSSAPQRPFLTMPTLCQSQLTSNIETDSWQDPGKFAHDSYASVDNAGNPAGVTGCGRLSFNPSITATPDTTSADSPSGIDVDVHVPQAPSDPNALATPSLRNATVTLPQGMSVSPSAADGLQACSPQQFGLTNASEPTCPNASKVGSAEIDSPLTADPLKGGIYLAQQNNNPFGSLLALYVATEADGVLIKLAAHVVPDPVTGQLVTTFTNNPQLPFTDFKLDFFGGPRGVIATPNSCGTFTTTSSLTPYSGGAAATPSNAFTINSGCVTGFAPTVTAGLSSSQAGQSSPFVLSLARSDTDQELSGLRVSLPTGLLAKIAGVTQCSDAQANAGTCPSDSQVGTALTGAGPGSSPFFLPGKVYLTGPYRGAPYGLVEVVPALAGPLNLGTVIVRQSLSIDKTDAHVTVVSDPLPTILQGIPLRLRRIDVDLNRSGFMQAPTSCAAKTISTTLTSTAGLSITRDDHFQVGGCGDLAFSPKMKLGIKGKTGVGKHAKLTVTVSQPGGQAHLKSVKVTLPLSLALDAKTSQNVCSVSDAAADNCPADTLIGHATANTPLLSTPLSGNAFLVQGIRRNKQGQAIKTLPSLLVTLRGAIALDLTGKTSVSHKKLVTTFGSIPDAAISKFVLTINGGSKGILAITRNLCKTSEVAGVKDTGQSGKTHTGSPKIATPCKKK